MGTTDEWTSIKVCGWYDLVYELERAGSKGYMPDQMREAWQSFDWSRPTADPDSRPAELVEWAGRIVDGERDEWKQEAVNLAIAIVPLADWKARAEAAEQALAAEKARADKLEEELLAKVFNRRSKEPDSGIVRDWSSTPLSELVEALAAEKAAREKAEQLLEDIQLKCGGCITPAEHGAALHQMTEALTVAADTLLAHDKGDPSTETGWDSDEMLEAWKLCHAALGSEIERLNKAAERLKRGPIDTPEDAAMILGAVTAARARIALLEAKP